MLFYVTYGCEGVGSEEQIVEAECRSDAEEYAYESALDYRSGYEGICGILSYSDFCEENGIEDEDAYNEMVENEIFYTVESYNAFDTSHRHALDEYEIYEI